MISGTTKLAAVVGNPVRHSLSPIIHNAAFAAAGLDWVYVALPVHGEDGRGVVAAMRTLGIDGMSVTMPHKAAVAEAADEVTDVVAKLGVSNCLYRDGDRIVAHSTDGDGFLAAYAAAFDDTLVNKRVLVVGAGGAARAIVEAVGRSSLCEIVVMNRSRDKAESMVSLADRLSVASYGDAASVADAEVIVNTTAVGMAGGPDPAGCPVPVEALHRGHTVVDIVYEPRPTPLLRAASECGAVSADGVGMLIHQAALAFVRWTGVEAPLAAMEQAANEALARPLD